MEPISVDVEYWRLPEGRPDQEIVGISDFRSELESKYTTLVRGHPGARGGGLYELAIHIASSISLEDVVRLILDGVAFDLVKSGARSFVLKPLLLALQKLRQGNQGKQTEIGVSEIKLTFQDADILITRLDAESLEIQLGRIFSALAENFSCLKLNTRAPSVVHIPVVEDPDARFARFRSLLDVDETVVIDSMSACMGYWGVRYHGSMRVFNVARQILLDERYLTQKEYWHEFDKAWQREHPIV